MANKYFRKTDIEPMLAALLYSGIIRCTHFHCRIIPLRRNSLCRSPFRRIANGTTARAPGTTRLQTFARLYADLSVAHRPYSVERRAPQDSVALVGPVLEHRHGSASRRLLQSDIRLVARRRHGQC